VVIGGHAAAFHGHPRATKDLDVLVRGSRANSERVYCALAAFGAPLAAFEVKVDLRMPGMGSLEEVLRAIVRRPATWASCRTSSSERSSSARSRAARLLGLTRATLRYRLVKHGLEEGDSLVLLSQGGSFQPPDDNRL